MKEKEDFAVVVKKDGIVVVPAIITYAEVPEDVEFEPDDLITDLPVNK